MKRILLLCLFFNIGYGYTLIENKPILLLVLSIVLMITFIKSNKRDILIVAVSILLFTNLLYINLKVPVFTNYEFKVCQINRKSYYLCNNQGKIILYTNAILKKNELIIINQPLKRIVSNNNFMVFNYEKYLRGQKIYYQVNQEVVNDNLKNNNNKINQYFNYLFFGINDDLDEGVINALSELNVIHLVVVSGLQFNLLFSFLSIIIFINNPYFKKWLIFIILFIYLYKLNFSYPALAVFLNLILNNNKNLFKLDKMEKFGITFMVLIFLFPLALFSSSFYFILVINCSLAYIPKELKDKPFISSLFIFLGIIPLILMINYQISIFSLLTNYLYVVLVSILYFLIICATIIPILSDITLWYISFFEEFSLMLNSYNVFIKLGAFSDLVMIIYYLIYYYSIKYYNNISKSYYLVLIYLVINYFAPNLNGSITFLDVGQAECIIIRAPFTNEVMMIDVGQAMNKKSVKQIVLPYLKSQKIRYIGLLVITHHDSDHDGGYQDLVTGIKVNKVIDQKQANIYYQGYHFIDLLSDTEFKDVNANSITLYTRINGTNFLFTGDINYESELALSKKVKSLPVDVLKVAHHGSKSSTSESFIRLIKPKYAIISVGLNNTYQHPHPSVINLLDKYQIKVYQTSQNGMIIYRFNDIIKTFINYQ